MLGPYNAFVDEVFHVLISSLTIIGVLTNKITLLEFAIIFLLGIFIDLDHLLNLIIARLYCYDCADFKYGSRGISIKVMHGLDIAMLASIIVLYFSSSWLALFLFFNLVSHELWDYLVYPHSWKELFLCTRILNKFKPGIRKYGKGAIFKLETLKY